MKEPKNELPYMPVVVAEELATAEDLTNEQLGALYRLKLKLWRANGYLPEDKLINAARAGKRWGAIAATILEHLTVIGGKVSCGAILIALEATRARRAERAERGARAASARWELGRVRDSGKPISGVAASAISDALLKATKSLSDLDPTMLGALQTQCLPMPNQNQNNIANRILSTGGAAAGLSDEAKSSSGIAINGHQYAMLYQHGGAVLASRLGLRALQAQGQIANWLGRTGDADRLAMFLGAADQENLRGSKFFDAVEASVAAVERDRQQSTPAALSTEGDAAPTNLSTMFVDKFGANEAVADPRAWLDNEGRRLLIEITNEYPGKVDTTRERWLRKVNFDHAALVNILRAAATRAKGNAAHFTLTVGIEIERYLAEQDGPQLALKGELRGGTHPQTAESSVDNAAAAPTEARRVVNE